MEIPDWFVWLPFGPVVLQVPGLVPVIGRLRGSDPSVRFRARLDLLEGVGGLLLLGGLPLSLVVTESWFWSAFAGFALMTAVYAVKGVHLLRARRRPTA